MSTPTALLKIRHVGNSFQVSRHLQSDTDARGALVQIYVLLRDARANHPTAIYCGRGYTLPEAGPLDGKVTITRVRTMAAVGRFFGQLLDAGVSFHPDDRLLDIVECKSGRPSFSPREAKRLDTLMNAAWKVCGREEIDIHSIGIDLMRERGLIPAENE